MVVGLYGAMLHEKPVPIPDIPFVSANGIIGT